MATKQERYDATREAIIKAGRELLSQREAKDIKIKDIMGACHLSPGLFYHYYDSKDDFIVALVIEAWDENGTYLEDPSLPPLERIRKYALTTVYDEIGINNPKMRRNLTAYKMTDAYVRSRERVREDEYMLTLIKQFFETEIKKGTFSADLPVEFVSRMIVYVVHGVHYNVSLYDREPDVEIIMAWCNQFFDFLEDTQLKPYMLKA